MIIPSIRQASRAIPGPFGIIIDFSTLRAFTPVIVLNPPTVRTRPSDKRTATWPIRTLLRYRQRPGPHSRIINFRAGPGKWFRHILQPPGPFRWAAWSEKKSSSRKTYSRWPSRCLPMGHKSRQWPCPRLRYTRQQRGPSHRARGWWENNTGPKSYLRLGSRSRSRVIDL